jgi:predicted dehydrogenase
MGKGEVTLIQNLNAGIVGLGKMGLLHAGIMNSLDGVKITAIAEKEKVLVKYVKESLPDVHVYEDFNEMFDSGTLDVAFITTPVSSHFPIAQSCIHHGIHFFMEKPLCKNIEEARKLCEELKSLPQIIHSVGFNRRFIDTFARAKSILETGILGHISSVNSTMYVSNIFSNGTGWRSNKNMSGGGVLLDLGSHVIDLLLWYFGPIDRVISSQLRSIYSTEVDDAAHALFTFASGVQGEIDTSWSVPGYRLPELNIIVKGSNGRLRVNEDFIEMDIVEPSSQFQQTKLKLYKQSLGSGVPIDLGGSEYTKEDVHVVNCIREKRQTLVNAYQAAHTQSAIEAMYDSGKANSSTRVEYFG